MTTSEPLTNKNTIARRSLYSYHFREADIERLFPEPDLVTESGQQRYAVERVQLALDTDEVLIDRATGHYTRKERRLARIVRSGKVVVRRIDDRWLLAGEDLVEGTIVEVDYRTGDTGFVGVGRVVRALNVPEGKPLILAERMSAKNTLALAERLASNG